MVITGKQVFINYPKTGSNFVREVLRKIYQRRYARLGLYGKFVSRWNSSDDNFYKELEMPIIQATYGNGKTPHGWYSQIPERYRGREVVSVVRNPYDRFLSVYDFRDWARYPRLPREVIEREFPDFPNLDFETFQKFVDAELKFSWLAGIEMSAEIGFQTVQFIKFFFRDPVKILNSIDEKYIDSERFLDDMPKITLLSTENLNRDLHRFLLKAGILPEEADFILNYEKVNITENSTFDRNRLWTKDIVDHIEYKERFLLKILKYFGFDYKKPMLQH